MFLNTVGCPVCVSASMSIFSLIYPQRSNRPSILIFSRCQVTKIPTLHNMSQEFLNNLLSTPENRVQTKCMICLENYNTLNTLTGIVEWEIRLPCGHSVGSACIVTWLKANNSCPACRETFFPAQPRPYLEHGIIDAARPQTAVAPAELPAVPMDLLSRDLSVVFHDPELPNAVSTVAASIARLLRQHLPHFEQAAIAAVSVYMSSYLLHRPINHEDIARVSGIDAARIRSVYISAYFVREQLIDVQMLDYVIGDYVEGMLAFLPLPGGGNGIIDDVEARREVQRQHMSRSVVIEEMKQILIGCSYGIDEEYRSYSIFEIAMEISKMGLLERQIGLISPPVKVAVGLYMAKHLLGNQIPARRIAELVDVNEDTLYTAYARVYPVRDQLIKPFMLGIIGVENLPRALEALPALSWPPLIIRLGR